MSFRPAVLLIVFVAATLPAGRILAAGPYPEATATSPTGDSVPLDAAISITWSLRMNATAVEDAFSVTDGAATWYAGAFQWTHSSIPPWKSRATPIVPMPALANMTVRVDPNATDVIRAYALDQDGDGIGGEPSDALQWTFRTENGRPPRVLSTAPPDLTVGVPVDGWITVTFDERMDPDSVAASFSSSPTIEGAQSWNPAGTTFTFVPSLWLRYGTSYWIVIGGKDIGGHSLDGDGNGMGGDAYAFGFVTTPPPAPPAVLSVYPSDGAANVSVSTDLRVRFRESMDRASVAQALTFTDGIRTWNATDGTLTWKGMVFADDLVWLNVADYLPFQAWITVSLNASIAHDPTGLLLDGDGDLVAEGSPTDDVTWSFGTESTDADAPTVLAVVPGNGSAAVLETTTVRAWFSEPMDRTSVEDAFSLADTIRTWTKVDGGFAWGPGNDSFEYAPTTVLSTDMGYTVRIAASALDGHGNPLEVWGPETDFVSTFRTRSPPDTYAPHVLTTNPADGATGVSRTIQIAITFDDRMDRATTEAAIALAAQSGSGPTPVEVGDFAWDAEDHVASFRSVLALLAWDTAYLLTVSQAAQDDAGNRLPSPHTVSFRTAAWIVRVIGRVVDGGGPVAGATVQLGNQTTIGGADGTFEFPSAHAGTFDLAISKAGYAAKHRTVELSAAAAGADGTLIDLGDIALGRAAESSVAFVVGGLLTALAAVLGVALWIRRRRSPPDLGFEDLEPEPGEAER